MKGFLATNVALCMLVLGASGSAVKHRTSIRAVNFGPRSCVSLTRSDEGSCVITTNCEGIDTSNTEFAFNCVGKGLVRHSFGLGGFDSSEEFDTEVKCDRCDVATSPADAKGAVPLPKPAAPRESKTSQKSTPTITAVKSLTQPVNLNEIPGKITTKSAKPTTAFGESSPRAKTEESQATASNSTSQTKPVGLKIWPLSGSKKETPARDEVKYGPNGCVTVHKNKEGHCVMETQCKKEDLAEYEFGLVCVDKVGSPVKHLFGKNSFDPVETFDTLIKCEECLGLENVPDSITLAGEVASMQKDIANIKDVVTNISVNVKMLNEEVFESKGSAPAAPAPAPAVNAPPATAAFLRKSTHHHRRHKRHHLRHRRHHHRHHHHRKHNDDDDDDADSSDGEEEQSKPVQRSMAEMVTDPSRLPRSVDEADDED